MRIDDDASQPARDAKQQFAAWQKRNACASCQRVETLATLRDCGNW
jgi:hypothetical protein